MASKPSKPSKAKLALMAAEETAIASASYYTVVRFVGRSPTDGAVPREALWDRVELPTLAAARELKAKLGTDEYGRRPMIYAVATSGASIHVAD